MSTQSTSSGSFSTLSSNQSKLAPTFEFDHHIPSSFEEDTITNAMEFDQAFRFKDVSPVVVPSSLPHDDSVAWLSAIPVIDPFEEEMKLLATRANLRSLKVVTLCCHIDFEETILHHIRGVASWYTKNGPAPRTLDERKKNRNGMDIICYLIFLQISFFGDDSLTPWQFTIYTKLGSCLNHYTVCALCNMPEGTWCKDVVLV